MKIGWKLATMMAAMLAVALCVSAVRAADQPAKPKVVEGTITKIDGANVTIQPGGKADVKPAAVVVVTNDQTEVHIGDAKKAVSDLAAGQVVRVVLNADGSAAKSITVRKAPAKG